MGNARARGTYDERVAQAISAGRVKPRSVYGYQPAPPLPVAGLFSWLDSFLPKRPTAQQIKNAPWSERAKRRAARKAATRATA